VKLFKRNQGKSIADQLAEVQQEIARWEAIVEKLVAQESAASAKLNEYENKRQQYLLAAHAENNAVARKELDRLQVSADRTRREASDLASALEQAESKLQPLREEAANLQEAAVLQRAEAIMNERHEHAEAVQSALASFLSVCRDADAVETKFEDALVQAGLKTAGYNTMPRNHREWVLKYITAEFASKLDYGYSDMGFHQGMDLAAIVKQNSDAWTVSIGVKAAAARAAINASEGAEELTTGPVS
jgi:hypothetical protein